MLNTPTDSRYLMWIDAVGGFLVCLRDEVVFGPPGPKGSSDVAILADISHRHIALHRDGETYLVESHREVKIDGRRVGRMETLTDGNIVELGRGVQLRFRQPHALSATARLEVISRHRIEPAADAILLMADSCVLGPGSTSHVVCPRWQHDVILFREHDRLACRSRVPLTIAGHDAVTPAPVPCGAEVAGDDFAFTLESVY